MLTYERLATALGICLYLGAGVVAWVFVPPMWLLVLIPVIVVVTFLRTYGRQLDHRMRYIELPDESTQA